MGRGQIGKVKYLEVGRAGGRGPSIPASVIKTGVKLPQLQSGSLLLQEEDKVGSDHHNTSSQIYLPQLPNAPNYYFLAVIDPDEARAGPNNDKHFGKSFHEK